MVLTEDAVDVSASDNMVLRGSVFVYQDTSILGRLFSAICFNCGEDGHIAGNCQMEKRLISLVPRDYHSVTRGQDWFTCKKGGHMAKDCPDKPKKNNQQSTLCLRCGETDHDMFGFFNDYPPDDIKEIKCYVCKQNGHLCCADFSDTCPKELTCYSCAQSGLGMCQAM